MFRKRHPSDHGKVKRKDKTVGQAPAQREATAHREAAASAGVRDELELTCRQLVAEQLVPWGIPAGGVDVLARQIGRAPDGKPVLIGMVRLATWDNRWGIRLLLGVPVLEAAVTRSVRGSWLMDYCHFGGVWLHASSQLHAQLDVEALNALLAQLVPESAPVAVPGGAEPGSYWANLSGK